MDSQQRHKILSPAESSLTHPSGSPTSHPSAVSAAAWQGRPWTLNTSPLIPVSGTSIFYQGASQEDGGAREAEEEVPSSGALPFLPGEGADICASPGAFVRTDKSRFPNCRLRGGFCLGLSHTVALKFLNGCTFLHLRVIRHSPATSIRILTFTKNVPGTWGFIV